MAAFSDTQRPLRLAMLGMIPGNGHPYSWSAIVNGYNAHEMAKCPYPAIPRYLGEQPTDSIGISGAEVTHIWTDDPSDARAVAAAARIPNVCVKAEDVIGQVDAVLIATDDGTDHVRRARPFVEAGIPVFVDKPLAITREELIQFSEWHRQGARILSSSCMRYAPELKLLEGGSWLWLTSITCKTWERYGVHAFESVYKLLGPGFTHVRCESQAGSDIVYCQHKSGAQATISAIHEAYGCFGVIHAYGKEDHRSVQLADTYSAFRNQLISVVDWLRDPSAGIAFAETQEIMAVLIAGQESRLLQGQPVSVSAVLESIP